MTFKFYEVWNTVTMQDAQQYDSLTEAITKTLANTNKGPVVPVVEVVPSYHVLDNLTSCLRLELADGDIYHIQSYTKQDGYGLSTDDFVAAVEYIKRQGWASEVSYGSCNCNQK